jgi:hypothetical protein
MKSQLIGRFKIVGLLIGSVAVLLAGCVLALAVKSRYEYYYGFDRQQWLDTGKVLRSYESKRILLIDNPRESMVEDVMEHYLHPGMTRAQVVGLLGSPERDGIEQWLPDNVHVPDSLLSTTKPFNEDAYTKWFEEHAQPDTLIRYRVGWDAVDPTSLRIRFGGNGGVNRYWVGVH